MFAFGGERASLPDAFSRRIIVTVDSTLRIEFLRNVQLADRTNLFIVPDLKTKKTTLFAFIIKPTNWQPLELRDVLPLISERTSSMPAAIAARRIASLIRSESKRTLLPSRFMTWGVINYQSPYATLTLTIKNPTYL